MKNQSLAGVSTEDLRRAVTIREQIEQLEGELQGLLGGGTMRRGGRGRPPGRRGRGRGRPSAALKDAKPTRRRRKPNISAAGRKRISDAAKARWARIRAAKKG